MKGVGLGLRVVLMRGDSDALGAIASFCAISLTKLLMSLDDVILISFVTLYTYTDLY